MIYERRVGHYSHLEDREEDVFLLKYAFQRAQITNPLQLATNGQEAIDYLSGTGRFGDRKQFPRPSIVLLDLKLRHVMGLESLNGFGSNLGCARSSLSFSVPPFTRATSSELMICR